MYKSGNVTLMVADMDRAVELYVEKLGLELKVGYANEWAEVAMPAMPGIPAAPAAVVRPRTVGKPRLSG